MTRRPGSTFRRVRLVALLPLLVLNAAAQPDASDAGRTSRARTLDGGEGEAATAEEILSATAPELRARLQEEKVVLVQEFGPGEESGGMIHALVMFERPRDEVIRFLIQSPRQIEFRPELRAARLVEEYETGHLVEYEIRMMLMRVHYRVRHGWDFRTGEIWWSLDPDFDNDLAVLEGRWQIFSLGAERALGRLGIVVDIGPALPAFLQDFATRRKLPESMQRTRKWVDSRGTYRP